MWSDYIGIISPYSLLTHIKFKVWQIGFRIPGSCFGIHQLGFKFTVWDSGFRVPR